MSPVFASAFLLLVCLYLGFVCVLVSRATGVWFNPSSIFSAAWVVYLGVPFVLGGGLKFNPAAAIYIACYITLFSGSALFLNWAVARKVNAVTVGHGELYRRKSFKLIFFAVAVAGVGFFILDLYLQGGVLSFDVLSISGWYAEKRYNDGLVESNYARFGLVFSIAAAVFGGLIVGSSKKHWTGFLLAILSMGPAIFVMLIQSAKVLFFLVLAIFFGAWLTTRVDAGRLKMPNLPIATILALGSFVFVIVVLSFVARVGFDLEVLRYYIVSYAGGHFFAFSDWFSDRYFGDSLLKNYQQPDMQGGFYTFMAVFRLLGDDRFVPLGTYDEFYEVPSIIATNIYTVFRGLIQDFGFFGALIFAAVSGFIMNFAFYLFLVRKKSVLLAIFYIYSVALIYQSYGISSLIWPTIPASAFLVVLVIKTYKILAGARCASYSIYPDVR